MSPAYWANATGDGSPTLTVSFPGLSGGVVAEDAGRMNVRLTLLNPPATGTYTGCRLRLGAGSDAETPADVTFSNQKKLRPENGWTAQAGLMTLVDDALAEGDERLVVEGHCTGSSPGTQPPHTDLISQPLVLTITDNDEPGEDPPPPPPPPTLTVSFPGLLGGVVAEDAGRVNAQLTLLDPPASGGYTGCRLRLGAGGAAQVSADVTFSNQKKLDPENGWTAQAGLMTLVDDALVEGDERLVVEGHCTGSKPGTQPPHTDLISQPIVLTIADNDKPPPPPTPTLILNFDGQWDGVLAEDAGEVSARLRLADPPASGGYTGCGLRLGAGGDARTPADVTFPNRGELGPDNGWTARAEFMTLVDDALVEGDETLVVEGHCTGSRPGTQPPHSDLISQPLVLTIADNDEPPPPPPPPTPTLRVSLPGLPGGVVAEGAGRVSARLTLIDPPASGGYTGCRLRLGAGGDARTPADVTFPNRGELGPDNGWTARAEFMTLVDDALVEGDETLVVEGHCTGSRPGTQPPHSDLISQPLVLTIADNDELTPPPPTKPTDEVRIHHVPLFLSAADPTGREGFIRIINRGTEDAAIEIKAYDDSDWDYDPITLEVAAGGARHLNSWDLELGNADKGLSGGLGAGQGDWRLEFRSAAEIDVLAYVRTGDGFVTAMHDAAPLADDGYRVAFFNPGSNTNQVSSLRLVNPGSEAAEVTIAGLDARGHSPGAEVLVAVPAGASRTFTSAELEAGGDGMTGALGDGAGKWRLLVQSAQSIIVMSLLESPTGHLTNLSTAPGGDEGGVRQVPLFLSAADPLGREGFIRVVNRGSEDAAVEIKAFDDSNWDYAPVTFEVAAGGSRHFNSRDLELGNADKGLSGGLGAGQGDWRLEFRSEAEIDVLAYVRNGDGFVTAMHDVAPLADDGHWVAFFNPGANTNQVSSLRLVNPGAEAAEVTIAGLDDRDLSPGAEVLVAVPAGASRTFTSAELEAGGDGMTGALGDGTGKWRLLVQSEQPIIVMSLLESPTGHLTNLSTTPSEGAFTAQE